VVKYAYCINLGDRLNMEMKNYNLRDTRPIFKWMYFAYGLSFISTLLLSLISEYSLGTYSFIFIIYIVVAFIIYKLTNQDVYVDTNRIKVKNEVQFMNITKITATADILIWNDNTINTIKVIDIENNYEKYKELMEDIYSKVDEKTTLEFETVNELLKQVYENKMRKMNIYVSSKTGTPALGGWLLVIMIMSCVIGLNICTPLLSIVTLGRVDFSMINMSVQSLIGIVTAILLYKRKNSVKYALAVNPVLSFITGINTVVINLISGFSVVSLLLSVLYLIVLGFALYFMAKVYLYYIDNFKRPKLTLIN